VDLKTDTVIQLASHPNIRAIKDATGELNRVHVLREACGPTFKLLSGDDATGCEFMLQGGDGVISVTANVAAMSMRQLCDAAIARRRAEAEIIDAKLQPLHRTLFCESNPMPVKWAVQQMGLIGPGIRLPLVPLAPQYHAAVREAMAAASVRVAAA
jgi:4-hydroxy-tetrahydrodipicolinate synthase